MRVLRCSARMVPRMQHGCCTTQTHSRQLGGRPGMQHAWIGGAAARTAAVALPTSRSIGTTRHWRLMRYAFSTASANGLANGPTTNSSRAPLERRCGSPSLRHHTWGERQAAAQPGRRHFGGPAGGAARGFRTAHPSAGELLHLNVARAAASHSHSLHHCALLWPARRHARSRPPPPPHPPQPAACRRQDVPHSCGTSVTSAWMTIPAGTRR